MEAPRARFHVPAIQPHHHLPDRWESGIDDTGNGPFHGDRLVEHRHRRAPCHDIDTVPRACHGRSQVADLGAGGGRPERRSNEQLGGTSVGDRRRIANPDHQRQRRLLKQTDQVLYLTNESTRGVELNNGRLRSVGRCLLNRIFNKADQAPVERSRYHDYVEWSDLLSSGRWRDDQSGQHSKKEEEASSHADMIGRRHH